MPRMSRSQLSKFANENGLHVFKCDNKIASLGFIPYNLVLQIKWPRKEGHKTGINIFSSDHKQKLLVDSIDDALTNIRAVVMEYKLTRGR